jgi:hypothetical protein
MEVSFRELVSCFFLLMTVMRFVEFCSRLRLFEVETPKSCLGASEGETLLQMRIVVSV